MPAYEILCILKAFERPELAKAVKKGAEMILQRGGIIRSFENLGYKSLPYRMKKKNEYHTNGNYILIKFDAPSKEAPNIQDEFNNNVDYIRSTLAPLQELEEPTCICSTNGEFKKDRVNYLKPLSTWNRRKIYRDYSVRL